MSWASEFYTGKTVLVVGQSGDLHFLCRERMSGAVERVVHCCDPMREATLPDGR